MKHFKTVIVVLGALAFTSACAQIENFGVTKRDQGALLGAVAGGVAGSQIGDGSGQLVATGVGTLLGALVGSEIGLSLSKADQAYAQQAFQKAHYSPLGETVVWDNPETNHRGSYTPIREGRTADNDPCRQYEQTIIVEGRAETAVGTACQNADGTWRIIN